MIKLNDQSNQHAANGSTPLLGEPLRTKSSHPKRVPTEFDSTLGSPHCDFGTKKIVPEMSKKPLRDVGHVKPAGKSRAPRQTNAPAGGPTARPLEQPSAAEPIAAATKPSAPEEKQLSDAVPGHLRPIAALLTTAIAAMNWEKVRAILEELGQKSEQGDRDAARLVAHTLESYPFVTKVLGDSSYAVERLLIGALQDNTSLMVEAIGREVVALRASLSTESDTSLEKMAVQQVVMAHLFLQYNDAMALAADRKENHSGTWARRQELAEKRFQSSLKSLKLARQASRSARPKMAAVPTSSPPLAPTVAKDPAANKKQSVSPAKSGIEKVENPSPVHEETANCLSPDVTTRPGRRTARKPVPGMASTFAIAGAGSAHCMGRAVTVVS